MEKTGTMGAGRNTRTRAAVRAFTLMELLVVTSILAVLASITLLIGRGVSERSKVAQARAEMAVLAAALEQYKQQYGDYPWTPDSPPAGVSDPRWDGGAVLFNALCGNLGPKATQLTAKGRTWVDLARFTLDLTDEASLPLPDQTDLRVNWFNDPWGGWYYYHYKKSGVDTAWKSRGFLLYSHGPDSECFLGAAPDSPPNTGLLENLPTDATYVEQNRDNIYHGRN